VERSRGNSAGLVRPAARSARTRPRTALDRGARSVTVAGLRQRSQGIGYALEPRVAPEKKGLRSRATARYRDATAARTWGARAAGAKPPGADRFSPCRGKGAAFVTCAARRERCCPGKAGCARLAHRPCRSRMRETKKPRICGAMSAGDWMITRPVAVRPGSSSRRSAIAMRQPARWQPRRVPASRR
jgi:hypothetical protein